MIPDYIDIFCGTSRSRRHDNTYMSMLSHFVYMSGQTVEHQTDCCVNAAHNE
jgi:hypothetical protein